MNGALRTDWESCIQQAWIKELFLCCCDKPRPPLWPRERLRFSSYSSHHRNTLVNYSQNKWVQGQISMGWSLVSFCLYRKIIMGSRWLWERKGTGPWLPWHSVLMDENFLQVHTSTFIQQWCWICRNVTTCSVNLCDMDKNTLFLLHYLHWMRARTNLWLEQCSYFKESVEEMLKQSKWITHYIWQWFLSFYLKR